MRLRRFRGTVLEGIAGHGAEERRCSGSPQSDARPRGYPRPDLETQHRVTFDLTTRLILALGEHDTLGVDVAAAADLARVGTGQQGREPLTLENRGVPLPEMILLATNHCCR